MEVEMVDSDSSIGNKVKHQDDQGDVKPTNEANSSGSLNNNDEDEDDEDDDDEFYDYDAYDDEYYDDGEGYYENDGDGGVGDVDKYILESSIVEAKYLNVQSQFGNVEYDDKYYEDDEYDEDYGGGGTDGDGGDNGGGGVGDGDGGIYILESSIVEAEYLNMQAQFGNVHLSPAVEPSSSRLNDLPPVIGTTPVDHEIPNLPFCESTDVASSSALAVEDATNDESNRTYENFKLFDIVEDFSDHHFKNAGFQGQQPPRTWTKRIQDDWKILEKDLPDAIYVRAYEERMDLLRAVIVGPAGTPYHDGLFVFDIHFPPTYPDIPPKVYYHSGGLRLNPNMYSNGKVCLSLLNTWNGEGSEKWMPNKSTMLQVLVSIQALILNDKPFFNEPGHDSMYPGAVGEKKSKRYNEHIFILSLKTMIYTLRRPPKHFEDFVVGHFRSRAGVILLACRGYMEGIQVGSMVNGGIPGDKKSGSKKFKAAIAYMINDLVSDFSRCGATDCEQYRVEN